MLGRRLVSATVIISALLLLLYFDFQLGTDEWLGRPGIIISILCLVIGAIASEELLYMLRQRTPSLQTFVPTVAVLIMVVCSCLPVLWKDYPSNCPVGLFGWGLLGVTAAFGICCLLEIFRFQPDGESLDRLSRYGFAIVYLGILVTFIVANRLLYFDNAKGMLALIALIATVKMSDAWAYFVGKLFGKTKLSPTLSPGKTIEGAVGSVLGAWLAGIIVFYLVGPYLFKLEFPKPWWWVAIYGVAVTIAGIVGDLTESLIKRDSNCKDSSKWLPGLGGILDVVDSLVFAAPISFFMWLV